MKLTIEERVRSGIDLLQRKGPKGWRRRIKLTTLDVSNSYYCPLGQVYAAEVRGEFDNGYDYAYRDPLLAGELRHGDRTARYGFVPYEDVPYERGCAALTEEWKRQLREIPR